MRKLNKRPMGGWLVAAGVLLALPAAALASETGENAGGGMTHRMMMLVIQFGLMLFAARLGNIFFTRMKMPGVLGELFAGMVIGPFALGRIRFYGFAEGLFPTHGGFPVSPELYGLGAIAAIVLLFDVGLETDLSLLLKYSVAGLLVGAGGVAGAFILGAATADLFAGNVLGRHMTFLDPAALFLGIASTATSVGITARILSEKRKLDSPEGVTILSAAVIDDVMGMICLAVVLGITTASRSSGSVDWSHIAVIGGKAVAVWLAATIIGLIASRKISVLLKWFRDRSSIAIMALGLALILSGLFEEAGLAMIIGAYVMGLSLSRADIRHVVREKISPIYALLVPTFFCITGMLIDLGALTSPKVLAFGMIYTVLALAAKVIGCGLPAMLAGFNLRGALRVGVGMAPRGEVGLIIAGIGLSAGFLAPELFASVIMMVVVNTIVAPPALVLSFRNPARGTRKPVTGKESVSPVEFEFPTQEMAEFFTEKLREVFEAEGFFVHHLGHDRPICQLRKDRTVIDYVQDGPTLTFSCDPSELPLVNTAVYEALAALEQALRGMKQPLDATAISEGMLENGPLGPHMANLKGYLTPDLVEPNLQGKTKAAVIDELLALLARRGVLRDVAEARKAVWERENSMSTGLQYGVAIPHGKTDAVDRLVCAVGVHRDGVDFGAMDRQPSRLFVLTLSPRSKPAPHIQFMSAVSQVLNQAGRERILACRTAAEICEVFTGPAKPAAPARRILTSVRFSDYIRPELVVTDLRGATKEAVIRELLGVLDRNGRLRNAEEAARVVLEREAQLSTGMEEGVAIPHGRTDAVAGMVCAVGVKKDGLNFGAVDGKPTRIIVLVLTSEHGTDPYLQFVASVMGSLDAEGRQAVLAAATPEELCRALTHEVVA